ncbi:MAG: hypothetical protein Q4E87_04275, partial [bacterium]|nr:hypothetical protein [bacterium]
MSNPIEGLDFQQLCNLHTLRGALFTFINYNREDKGICQRLLSEISGISFNLLVIESKQPHQKNFCRIAQRIRKRSTKTLSYFE